jgi:hypothetical protein
MDTNGSVTLVGNIAFALGTLPLILLLLEALLANVVRLT